MIIFFKKINKRKEKEFRNESHTYITYYLLKEEVFCYSLLFHEINLKSITLANCID